MADPVAKNVAWCLVRFAPYLQKNYWIKVSEPWTLSGYWLGWLWYQAQQTNQCRWLCTKEQPIQFRCNTCWHTSTRLSSSALLWWLHFFKTESSAAVVKSISSQKSVLLFHQSFSSSVVDLLPPIAFMSKTRRKTGGWMARPELLFQVISFVFKSLYFCFSLRFHSLGPSSWHALSALCINNDLVVSLAVLSLWDTIF